MKFVLRTSDQNALGGVPKHDSGSNALESSLLTRDYGDATSVPDKEHPAAAKSSPLFFSSTVVFLRTGVGYDYSHKRPEIYRGGRPGAQAESARMRNTAGIGSCRAQSSADFCFRPTLRTQRRSPTSGIRPTPGSTAQFAAGHNHRGGGCGFCCAQGFTRRGRQFWYPGPTGSGT